MYFHHNLYSKKTTMAHVDLGNDLPGIRGPMAYRPETAAFCMYNRYVDGLATWAPQDRQFYVDRAPRRAAEGYLD